jgi:uncharacterized protein YaiL (DUF2058 family)
VPQAADETNIEDLVTENLVEQLKILHEKELGDALHDFVQKDEKTALIDTVNRVMKETWTVAERSACQDLEQDELQSIAAAISSAAEHRRYKISANHVLTKAAKVQAENSALQHDKTDATTNRGPGSFMSAVMQLGTDDRLTNANKSSPLSIQKSNNSNARKIGKTSEIEDLTVSPKASKSAKRQTTKRRRTQARNRADSDTEGSWEVSESSEDEEETEDQVVGRKRTTRASARSGARLSQFESTQPSLQRGRAIAGLRAQRTKADRSQISKWGALK